MKRYKAVITTRKGEMFRVESDNEIKISGGDIARYEIEVEDCSIYNEMMKGGGFFTNCDQSVGCDECNFGRKSCRCCR